MRKLSYYVCISILISLLSGCGDDSGGGSTSSTSTFYSETSIPSIISASNINMRSGEAELICSPNPNDATSKICCQHVEATGECKCYSCNKSYFTSLDLSSQCSAIDRMSESECMSFINKDINIVKFISFGKSAASKIQIDFAQVDVESNSNQGQEVDSKNSYSQAREVNSKKSINQRQQVIKSNIVKYLEEKADPIGSDLKEVIDWFKDEKNNLSNELSVFWLVTQSTNTLQPPYGHHTNFRKIEDAIYQWKKDDELSLEMQESFDRFIFAIYFFQYYPEPAKIIAPMTAAYFMENLLQPYKNLFSKEEDVGVQLIEILQQNKINIGSGNGELKEVIYSQKTSDTLKEGINSNALVFIMNDAADKVVAAIFKQNNSNYHYYNPGSSKGEIIAADSQDMVDRLYEDFDNIKVEEVEKLRFFVWSAV